MKILVIGAGIFGITIALELSKRHPGITLVDANTDIMMNASKVNHNRLHFGFHYPRSKATAKQSLDGFELFRDYFNEAILFGFDNYYMIEKSSNVSSEEYECFCDDLHLVYKKQFPKIDMDFDRIESSYVTHEPIFDYDLIKSNLNIEICKSGIKLILNKKVISKKDVEGYDLVVNASYFNINKINKILGVNQTKLKLQTVIIPIFKYNSKKMGITIMDGGFCSILPKGFNPNTFLLYHVKESVIYQTEGTEIPIHWYYGKEIIKNEFLKKHVYDRMIVKNQINTIVKESTKYFKFLNDCEIVDYWQTVRVLPINEDDERLSVFDVVEKDNQKIISVLSGKISTCLLIAKNISKII
jgi:hypothetical protein